MTREEAAKQFWQEVVAGVPDGQREALAKLVEDHPEILPTLGDGVLRQADYSRAMDAVNTRAREQQDWWQQNQPLVELGQKAKAAGFDPAKPPSTGLMTPAPVALPDDVVRREEIVRAEQGYVAFVDTLTDLKLKHLQEFGEVLDVKSLMQDPRTKEIGLLGVYESSVATRRAERQKTAMEQEIEKRVQAKVTETLRSAANPNFPVQKLEGSPLDALEPQKRGVDVDDLVNEYYAIANG